MRKFINKQDLDFRYDVLSYMGLFNDWNLNKRENENRLYAIVSDELENNDRDTALTLKARTEVKGDEKLADSLYVKYRIQQLKDSEYTIKQIDKKLNKNEWLLNSFNFLIVSFFIWALVSIILLFVPVGIVPSTIITTIIAIGFLVTILKKQKKNIIKNIFIIILILCVCILLGLIMFVISSILILLSNLFILWCSRSLYRSFNNVSKKMKSNTLKFKK